MPSYVNTRTFGDDILDIRDLADRFQGMEAPHSWDESDYEFAALFLQLKNEMWDDIDTGAENEPTLILDSYFEEYAEDLASDIGAIDRNANWPLNRIDWVAAAEDLQMDYSRLEVGPYTYWRRAY